MQENLNNKQLKYLGAVDVLFEVHHKQLGKIYFVRRIPDKKNIDWRNYYGNYWICGARLFFYDKALRPLPKEEKQNIDFKHKTPVTDSYILAKFVLLGNILEKKNLMVAKLQILIQKVQRTNNDKFIKNLEEMLNKNEF